MNIPGLEEQDQISLLVVATPVCWAWEKMHLTLVPIGWECATIQRVYIPCDLLCYKVISMLEIVELRKVISFCC